MTMTNKLISKISSIHNQIEALEKELSSVQFSDTVDRTNKLTVGSKVLMVQELNVKLFAAIELFLELEGNIDDLPKDVRNYYLMVEELRKPISDTDTEDVKKIKQFINNYKKDEV